MSTWPIAARRGAGALFAALIMLAGGCAPFETPGITRVALLAPFEGADRLIGYEALYAARMATVDAADLWLELLPIDEGNDQAVERARALAADPLVKVMIIVGDRSSIDVIQQAAVDLPVIVVGDEETGAANNVFAITDGPPPDAAFRERYLAENAFAPEPGALARSVYDATTAAIAGAQTGSRAGAADYLSEHLE